MMFPFTSVYSIKQFPIITFPEYFQKRNQTRFLKMILETNGPYSKTKTKTNSRFSNISSSYI